MRSIWMAVLAGGMAMAAGPAPRAITSHQVAGHAMRYHLALPVGWAAGGSWPVVVVIPDAHRNFEQNLRRFAETPAARGFTLVSPEVLSCGGTRDLTSPPYSYSPADWAIARSESETEFDDQGLAAVIAEVHARWGGETRAFLTGWEAGGHTVWAQALRRPERWRAVAPVTTNYQGRGLTSATLSTDSSRATLPIQVFWCGAPKGEVAAAMHFLRAQTDQALADARAHGFRPRPIRVVAGADHGPLPGPVMAWFDSLAHRLPAR